MQNRICWLILLVVALSLSSGRSLAAEPTARLLLTDDSEVVLTGLEVEGTDLVLRLESGTSIRMPLSRVKDMREPWEADLAKARSARRWQDALFLVRLLEQVHPDAGEWESVKEQVRGNRDRQLASDLQAAIAAGNGATLKSLMSQVAAYGEAGLKERVDRFLISEAAKSASDVTLQNLSQRRRELEALREYLGDHEQVRRLSAAINALAEDEAAAKAEADKQTEMERQAAKRDALLKDAREAADKGDFSAAIAVLENAGAAIQSDGEVSQTLTEFRRQWFDANRGTILKETQAAIAGGYHADAAVRLEPALKAAPQDPQLQQLAQEFQVGWRKLLVDASGPGGVTIRCAEDQSQMYRVWVPASLDSARPIGVIFGFDPGANAGSFIHQFKDVAQKHGLMLCVNENSQNGPWDVILNAQTAMMKDFPRRVRIDPKRSFASGFSGGARASIAHASRYPEHLSGALAQGAGGPNIEVSVLKPFPIIFLIGARDSNFGADVPRSAKKYERIGCRVATWTYDGAHERPPAEKLAEATESLLRWMEEASEQ